MSLFDEISDIFTGGLSTALDIEAEKARAEIDAARIAQDLEMRRRDNERLYPPGQTTVEGVAGIPWPLIFGAVSAGAALLMLLRR